MEKRKMAVYPNNFYVAIDLEDLQHGITESDIEEFIGSDDFDGSLHSEVTIEIDGHGVIIYGFQDEDEAENTESEMIRYFPK